MTFAQTCPKCGGSGQAATASCKSCHGTGYDEVKIVSKLIFQKV